MGLCLRSCFEDVEPVSVPMFLCDVGWILTLSPHGHLLSPFSAFGTYRLICKVLSAHSSISIVWDCVFTLTILDPGWDYFFLGGAHFSPLTIQACLPKSNNYLPDSWGSKMNPAWWVSLGMGIFCFLCSATLLSFPVSKLLSLQCQGFPSHRVQFIEQHRAQKNLQPKPTTTKKKQQQKNSPQNPERKGCSAFRSKVGRF